MTANLRSLIKEKRKCPMKRVLTPATALAAVFVLVLFAPAAFSQVPKSGALLSIDGTGSSSAVHIKLYDSQIHSGIVQAVPVPSTGNCTGNDQVPTDAYVLQGGAPTGCDPNDAYEVTDNNPNNSPHQAAGLITNFNSSGFRIETHYKSEPIVSITGATNNDDGTTTYNYSLTIGADLVVGQTIVTSGMEASNNSTFSILTVVPGISFTVTNADGTTNSTESGTGTVTGAVCNTTGSICATPDTGFITVTNNSGSPFTGTISLKGVSPTHGGDCPAGGVASDSYGAGLGTGGSVTLALSTDSSNCGGFNQAQTLLLSPNVTKTAFFGKDDYQITTLNSAGGDTLDVLPVPVPAGPLGSVNFTAFPNGQFGFGATPTAGSSLRFSTTMFPNLACVPYADFSADGNPVCVELQVTPTGSDPYLYTVQNDFSIDGHSLPNGIGGPAFLGHHAVPCPDTGFDQNIFLTYTAATVTFGDPLRGSSGGGGSCWVVAFDPSATAVTTSSSSFTGFQGLLPAPTLNPVHPGSATPLNFTFPTSGLHLCSTVNNSGSVCTGGASAPWVAFGTLSVNCATGIPNQSLGNEKAAGGSGLQTISSTPALTSYRFNWKSDKTAQLGSCVVMIVQFSQGLVVFPDDFQFVK